MGGEGSGRKPKYHDTRHKQIREAARHYYKRWKHPSLYRGESLMAKKFDDERFADGLLTLSIELCSKACNWSEEEENHRVIAAIKRCKSHPTSKDFSESEQVKLLAVEFVQRALKEGQFLTGNNNRFVV